MLLSTIISNHPLSVAVLAATTVTDAYESCHRLLSRFCLKDSTCTSAITEFEFPQQLSSQSVDVDFHVGHTGLEN
jgi:hypothetical protein